MRVAYLALATLLVAGAILAANAASKPDKAALAQGEYLVTRVAFCGHCHTPKLANGKPDQKRQFAGAKIAAKPMSKMPAWASSAPNLTPAGPLAKWSDGDVVNFLMSGKDRSGKNANPPMPGYRFKKSDAVGVATYLRSVKAAK